MVPEADEYENERDMDAVDEGEQTGVAAQVVVELEKGAQTFFGLGNKVGITLEAMEPDGVVDMGDRDVMTMEGLAQHDIFVAIMTEPLIERITEHHLTTNEKVGCVKVLIGR